MTINAALCWYDETPDSLFRCVRSLEGVADMLVSADGRWELFTGPMHSPLEQHEAIASAVAEAGLVHRVVPVDGVYESQVAKRSLLYRDAASDSDWFFVIDGDEFVKSVATSFRSVLAAATEDVVTVLCHNVTYVRPTRPIVHDYPHRRIIRSSVFSHVMEAHNGIVTHDGRWLAGPRRIRREEALDARDILSIEHRHWSRPADRNRRSKNYYEQRNRRRVEVA